MHQHHLGRHDIGNDEPLTSVSKYEESKTQGATALVEVEKPLEETETPECDHSLDDPNANRGRERLGRHQADELPVVSQR
jgi:hypothetical protein